MSDDKKKTGSPDSNRIAFTEEYEVRYAAQQLQSQVPGTTPAEAKAALLKAAESHKPGNPREPIMRAARKILKD